MYIYLEKYTLTEVKMTRYTRITKKSGPPMTGECDICGERTYLPYQCKKCLGIFCDKHHLPENHSCIPISKLIEEFKQFEERALPKNEEEEIQNRLKEKLRLIKITQTLYESGELSRSKYLETVDAFYKDKYELETKLKHFESSGANIEQKEPIVEKQDNEVNSYGHGNKYSYTVDEKYRREYVGNTNSVNYSHHVNDFGKDGAKEPRESKNRCQFCYSPIIDIPFKCHRCGLFYCVDHRLPENHWCAARKEYSTNDFIDKTKHSLKSKYNRVKNWLNRRNQYRYHNWSAFFMNFIWVAILSISFLMIYSNIEKLNEIILWLIPIGSAFLFINGILWIKYAYKLLKRLNYWFRGERNWVRYLTVFIILLLLWQAYQQRETVFNPTIYFNKSNNVFTNFNSIRDSVSGIAVETKTKQPEINIITLENRIHELINEKRRQNGLSALRYDSKLADIARKHSQDMATNNFFDHVNFNGEDPTARGLKSGYRCYKDYGSYYIDGLAENLFENNLYDSITYYNGIPSYDWNTPEEIAQSTVNGWMNSLGHRQNILTATYDAEGIGVAISSNDQVLITENFC